MGVALVSTCTIDARRAEAVPATASKQSARKARIVTADDKAGASWTTVRSQNGKWHIVFVTSYPSTSEKHAEAACVARRRNLALSTMGSVFYNAMLTVLWAGLVVSTALDWDDYAVLECPQPWQLFLLVDYIFVFFMCLFVRC